MKALLLDQPGPLTTLYVSDLPEPHPTAEQVRVKVYAAGLNYKLYSDPIRIVKGFRRKSFPQSPFTIQAFTNQIGLLYISAYKIKSWHKYTPKSISYIR